MSTEEYRTIRNQVRQLSTDEQFRLLEDLVAILKKKSRPQHSILELKGLGKEIWEGVDVDEYIRQERDSWESKNDELKTHSSSQNLDQRTNDDYSQVKKSVELLGRLAEDVDRISLILHSLQNTENIRGIGEKITQERD